MLTLECLRHLAPWFSVYLTTEPEPEHDTMIDRCALRVTGRSACVLYATLQTLLTVTQDRTFSAPLPPKNRAERHSGPQR